MIKTARITVGWILVVATAIVVRGGAPEACAQSAPPAAAAGDWHCTNGTLSPTLAGCYNSPGAGAGGITPGQQMMMQGTAIAAGAIGNYLGNQLRQFLFGNPQAEAAAEARQRAEAAAAARRRAQLEAQQRAAAAEAAAAAAAAAVAQRQRTDAIRAQLLGHMTHMTTFESAASPSGQAAAGGTTVNGIPMMGFAGPAAASGQSANFGKAGVGVAEACRTAIDCSADTAESAGSQSAPPPAGTVVNGVPELPFDGAGNSAQNGPAPQPVGLASWTPQLLRSSSERGGHPVGIRRAPAQCRALTARLNAIYALGRRAVLAADVYNRYGIASELHPRRGTVDTILPIKISRISDNRVAMRRLLGVNAEQAQQLLAPPDSGYRASIYQDPTDHNKIFLVFRGTANVKDWAANVEQQSGQQGEYFRRAIALARLVKGAAQRQHVAMEIIGHSLGGAMADAAGAVTRTTTVSFNPEGVHPNTLPPGFDLGSARRYVTDVVVNGEILNYVQDHRAQVKAALLATPPAGAAAGSLIAVLGGAKALEGAFAEHSLAPAIGARITLQPDPKDVGINPFRLHYMTSVIDAISNRFDQLYDRYKRTGCAEHEVAYAN